MATNNNIESVTISPKRPALTGDKSVLTETEKDKKGTIQELVQTQELTNKYLKKIAEKMGVTAGNSENSGGGIFGKNRNPFNEDSEATKRNISEGMEEGIEKSGFADKISSKFGDGFSAVSKILGAMRETLSAITGLFDSGIQQSISNQKQYMGPISARLQTFKPEESVNAYKQLSFQVRDIFTNSRYINQQELLQNLNRLVEAGIGYNLEDRAYLMTIADRTVKTYDLLDPSLNRIIRLQQTDLSRSQMGLEAQLTQFLNEYFQDTSYLSTVYDSVTANLLEATSQMSYEETTGYLYNAQKWLASLYSLGISEQAVSTIAQGLNYLGSGNVSQLTGNDQLNTLFAMSAQQAGLSYAQLLTTGVSAENVDKLLESMVNYLQSIAENTSSEVLRSEYGRVFGGFSVADLRAIQNLTSQDISNITGSSLTYEGAYDKLAEQMSYLAGRTSIAEQIENMYNNFIYSVGAQLAETPEMYESWVISNIVESAGDALGSAIGELFDDSIGGILSGFIGTVSEGIKASQLQAALMELSISKAPGTGINSQIRDMFDENYALMDEYAQIWGDNTWTNYYKVNTNGVYDIATDLSVMENFFDWSKRGIVDILSLLDNYQTGTYRMNGYSSSIALRENAFESSAANIEAAAESIIGAEDTVSQSLDDLYNGLFSDEARPIRVTIVDVDGNVLGSLNTSSYSSNMEVEENYGNEIFKLMPGIRSQE